MRVGVMSIMHESNTFAPGRTTLADFRSHTWLVGEAARAASGWRHHEVGGFFAGLAESGLEAVPLFVAGTTPSSFIAADAAEALVATALAQLEAAGPVDGLLLSAHGAAAAESHRDFDGHWLSLVRQCVGPDVPIVNTLDAHANISRRMVAACDATVVYRTNPHLDQRQVGLAAARLLARTLRGEVRPTQALATPPVAISIDRQQTDVPPCRPMYDLADAIARRPGVLSDSVALGFPYADVEEMGASFIVVTDDDPALAQRCGQELADWLVAHRHEFACALASVEEAVGAVRDGGPRTCLLDVGDNVGGGSPADGTVLAHALHEAGVADSFVCLYDPAAVRVAADAGPGATVRLSMGGHTDDQHGPPFVAEVTVQRLHDGRFTEPEPRHGGQSHYDMGQTAIVRTARGLTVMLTSRRMPPFSLAQLTGCGLDPATFRVLVAKGVNAPIAAYRTVCDRFIRVNTPGVTGADMRRFTYHHRRRPLFPFEEPV